MKTLYVSDLDGTLLTPDIEVSDFTAETLNRLIARGLNFSVATARTAFTVMPILNKINLNVPLILMNGTVVFDAQKREYLKTDYLPETAAQALFETLKKNNASGFVYVIEDGVLKSCYEKLDNEHSRVFMEERKKKYSKSFTKLESYSVINKGNIVFFSYADTFEKVSPIKEELEKRDDLHVEFYHDIYADGMWFLEVCNPAASKRSALDFLRAYGGYEKVVSFGDNLNDVPLFSGSDVSCAMANAKPGAIEKADFVILGNDRDGVARWIEEDFANG